MSTTQPNRPPGWAVGLLGAATGLAAVVVVLGLTGSSLAEPVGVVVSGVPATIAGAMLVGAGLRSGRSWRLRLVPGAAVLLWGLGQLALAVELAARGFDVARLPLPSVGDGVSALAAPLAVAGLALLPRRTVRLLDRSRTAVDALLITTTVAMAFWEVWFRDSLGGNLTPAAIPAAAILVLDVTIASVVLVTAVREMDLGIAVATVGIFTHAAGDAAAVLAGSGRLWASAAAACIALPLVVVGFSMFDQDAAGLTHQQLPRAETRRQVATASATSFALIVLLAHVLTSDRVAEPTEQNVLIVLSLVFLVVLWAREVLRARQSQQLHEQLAQLARTDPLTGLGNRRALTDSLLYAGRDEPAELGLLTMDLDNFKDVNSLLGHRAGDDLLTRVGAAMLDAVRDRDAQAFRLGGDEFAVLVRGPEHEATALGDRLLEATRSLGNEVPGVGRVGLSASIGVAHASSAGSGVEGGAIAALEHSAEAMRVSKRMGRGRVTRYSARLAEGARRRSAVERRLRAVVADGGIEAHYQPIIHVETGTVAGVEALSRWRDDDLGQVPPLEFIGIAEDTGLMPELGMRLLQVALEGFVSSGAAGRRATMGVNFSTLQLRMPGFAATVVDLVRASGVACEHIVVEVTESVLLDDDDPAVTAVHQLASAGMPVALDDFGTGYSSLAYLHRLPVAVLKLDRAMTSSMETDRGFAIARTVAEMGATLGIDVVAEGIETQRTADLAAGLGIPFVQGWLYARAMPPAELRRFMATRQTLWELRHAESPRGAPLV